MAMKYGDAQLDAVFSTCFKPAVEQTGFTLMRLDEEPRAGLIDDHLRLDIRRSRFLVADLSHANLGAYWEAGYAEGLGRPVIYTCRKDVFDDPKAKPHFDTNHHLTVVWDPSDLTAAAMGLKTTIRVTLPSEAKLDD
jgi:nucleoside 2-deoxyribosyltransferase